MIQHPANVGLHFGFDGRISRPVLENYLSRSMTCSGCFDGNPKEPGTELFDETVAMILRTGVKFVGRASCLWGPAREHTDAFPKSAEKAAAIHEADPEIILEACIFEYISRKADGIPVPADVFEAFGLPVEERCFRYDDMIFPDGTYRDLWGPEATVPDITRQETQLYFYFLATRYLDAGFEAIHMGQYYLIGNHDTDYACYTALNDRIRAYAKEHARRHFVLINAHSHGQIDANGKLMFDFHEWPSVGKVPEGSVAHRPTPDDPQELVLEIGYRDVIPVIYGDSMGGMTYSGWECASLPYTVELDNASECEHRNELRPRWGYDDISWFVNQPADYRAKWLRYAHDWIRDNDPNGHLMMPGVRCARLFDENDELCGHHYCNYAGRCAGDDEAIREIFLSEAAPR